MKSFVKKVTVLAVAFSMASSTLANAQEEDGKVNFSVPVSYTHLTLPTN